MNYFLVDYENVGIDGIMGLEGIQEKDALIIFYSETCKNITIELMEKVTQMQLGFKSFKVKTGTKNALDFQLSSYLGLLIGKGGADAHYYILSNDKGYDCLCDFWKEQGISVQRLMTRGGETKQLPAVRKQSDYRRTQTRRSHSRRQHAQTAKQMDGNAEGNVENASEEKAADAKQNESQANRMPREHGNVLVESAETSVSEAGKASAETSASEAGKASAETSVSEMGKVSAETSVSEVGKVSAETSASEAGKASAETSASESAKVSVETPVSEGMNASAKILVSEKTKVLAETPVAEGAKAFPETPASETGKAFAETAALEKRAAATISQETATAASEPQTSKKGEQSPEISVQDGVDIPVRVDMPKIENTLEKSAVFEPIALQADASAQNKTEALENAKLFKQEYGLEEKNAHMRTKTAAEMPTVEDMQLQNGTDSSVESEKQSSANAQEAHERQRSSRRVRKPRQKKDIKQQEEKIAEKSESGRAMTKTAESESSGRQKKERKPRGKVEASELATLEEIRQYLSEEDMPEEVLEIFNHYKSKQSICNGISKKWKDTKMTSTIYKKLKPLLKEKKKS